MVDISQMTEERIVSAETKWLYHKGPKAGRFEVYTLVPGTVLVNPLESTIRMRFKGQSLECDDSFEIVIWQSNAGYKYKSDTFDSPGEEYDLDMYVGDEDMILYDCDDTEEFYIHIETR